MTKNSKNIKHFLKVFYNHFASRISQRLSLQRVGSFTIVYQQLAFDDIQLSQLLHFLGDINL